MSQIPLPQNPGLGGIDELTASEELLVQNLAALSYQQGDVLYYDGAKLTNLHPGTSGQVLATRGASANPHWADVIATPPSWSRTFSMMGA